MNCKRFFLYAVLCCATIVFAATDFNLRRVAAAPVFTCASNPPKNYSTASSWSFPNGFGESDISQRLVKNSLVVPGEAHTGEDYGNKPAGTEITAVADGWVACTYSSDAFHDLGNAVFVQSVLPDGRHITTLYGHLAPDIVPLGSSVTRGVTRIGKLGTEKENGSWGVHLHVGIRDGFIIGWENGWPHVGWGYTCKQTGCAPNKDEEFKHWYALSGFVRQFPVPVQTWRTETQSLTFFLPWWRTFYTCDNRRIKAYLDDKKLFFTSAEDDSNPAKSVNVFLWPGSHTLEIDVFDYPDTPAVSLSWPLAPVGPTCAAETTPTPVVSTPTRAPIVVLPTVPLTRASTGVPPTTSLPTRVPTSASPTTVPNPTARTARDGAPMVFVPAGEFTMGSNDEMWPVHTVYLDAFWIDKFEVTNALYKKCADTGKCSTLPENKSFTRSSYYGNPSFDNYPVICVSWNDANAFCSWAGKRLPTEAEWEKAARGTDGRVYPWGNSFDKNLLNSYEGGRGDTTAVGSYPGGASPYGALDMAGNVWEWVADWYDSKYYANSPHNNPKGPTSGQSRVLRGGAWLNDSGSFRVSFRNYDLPVNRYYSQGFRCAQ